MGPLILKLHPPSSVSSTSHMVGSCARMAVPIQPLSGVNRDHLGTFKNVQCSEHALLKEIRISGVVIRHKDVSSIIRWTNGQVRLEVLLQRIRAQGKEAARAKSVKPPQWQGFLSFLKTHACFSYLLFELEIKDVNFILKRSHIKVKFKQTVPPSAVCHFRVCPAK